MCFIAVIEDNLQFASNFDMNKLFLSNYIH